MPKDTLNNIPQEKRERILREAALAFAERGYAATDMAALARRCGIAKGSIYNYFESKEELYVYVCRDGMEKSRSAVWGDTDEGWNIYQDIDHMFRSGVEFARAHPEFISIYLNAGSTGVQHLTQDLIVELEKRTADQLKLRLRQGINDGVVRKDLDVNLTAWIINNSYVMLLAALVYRHFELRMREYLDIPNRMSAEDVSAQRERTIQLLHSFLRPRS